MKQSYMICHILSALDGRISGPFHGNHRRCRDGGEFGIRTMLICGGGMINWSFLQAGLLDELSLLIAAAADGAPGKPTVFDKVPFLSEGVPKEFSLKSIERIGENGVWLKYQVKN